MPSTQRPSVGKFSASLRNALVNLDPPLQRQPFGTIVRWSAILRSPFLHIAARLLN
jgi:hypothetical protein